MLISLARLLEELSYDGETGLFTWRRSRRGVKAGSFPGSVHKHTGYVEIMVDGRLYLAHRLPWVYMTGNWPISQIDHRNGVRSDNSFANLREATNRSNAHNRTKILAKAGLLGVCRSGRGFKAAIRADGKSRYLGTYDTAKEAHAAYLSAKQTMHSV